MARTQVQLTAEGYDPTIGILHGRESEWGTYPAFALDRMEPMRPVADRAVLRIVNETKLSGGDFAIQPDGVCRLNPELARRVSQIAHEHVRDAQLSFRNYSALRVSVGSMFAARRAGT